MNLIPELLLAIICVIFCAILIASSFVKADSPFIDLSKDRPNDSQDGGKVPRIYIGE